MQSAKGLISEKEQTVFWVERHTGQIMLAPDTKLQPFRGWERVACATVAETESMSRRLAKQEFEKFRSLKVKSTSATNSIATGCEPTANSVLPRAASPLPTNTRRA